MRHELARRLDRIENRHDVRFAIVAHGPSETPEQAEARWYRDNPGQHVGMLCVVNTGIDGAPGEGTDA